MSDELERWAPETAGDHDRLGRRLPELLEPEAEGLAGTARQLAQKRSGALRRSILARGLSVLSDSPYAVLQSEGGIVRSKRYGWLTIPVRAGFVPGPGFATVRSGTGQIVVRSGTLQLWAVRRRQVLIRGNRFLVRALEQHRQQAADRVGARLVAEVTRG